MTEFLNWQTDPLLIDPTPLKQNNWVTANELLDTGQSERFLTPTGQLQLYPIMVRKVDFVSGERILQSFPYIKLDLLWIDKIRENSLALAEKIYYYFTDSNISKSIRSWQKRIISYLEDQQRLPFPLFRLVNSWEEFFQGKQFISFQSARGEDFQLPLYLTKDLVYLSGVVMGDGHLAEYLVNIIDSSKEHIENLTKLLESLFHSRTEFFEQQNANAWNVNLLGKWIVRFINFLTGQPINERKYSNLREPLLYVNNETFRHLFWRGVLDADGSYRTGISFATASRLFFADFCNLLSSSGISYKIYEQELFGAQVFSLTVFGKSRKHFVSLFGSNHPQKQLEIKHLLAKKLYRTSHYSRATFQENKWSGQIIGIKSDSLLNGYFDFSRLSSFTVHNIGDVIHTLRGDLTQKEFAHQLHITQSALSKYERNLRSVPLSLLLEFTKHIDYSFVNFLAKNPKLLCSSQKSSCYLDTKPNDTLEQILKGLRVTTTPNFYLIGLPDEPLESYMKLFSDYFCISVDNPRRVNNSVLQTFLLEFYEIRSDIY